MLISQHHLSQGRMNGVAGRNWPCACSWEGKKPDGHPQVLALQAVSQAVMSVVVMVSL